MQDEQLTEIILTAFSRFEVHRGCRGRRHHRPPVGSTSMTRAGASREVGLGGSD